MRLLQNLKNSRLAMSLAAALLITIGAQAAQAACPQMMIYTTPNYDKYYCSLSGSSGNYCDYVCDRISTGIAPAIYV
jgi:hypothetical protein